MAKNVDTPDDVKVGEIVKADDMASQIAVTPRVQVDVVTPLEERINAGGLSLPNGMEDAIDLAGWYYSLTKRIPYVEKDPEYITRKLLLKTAMATTVEGIFEHQKPVGLQGLIPNQPGASSGPVILDDLYVATSELAGGVPCFMVMQLTSERTGETLTTTTGAQELQIQILGLVALGYFPIRIQFKRIDAKDRGGRFMFRIFPAD